MIGEKRDMTIINLPINRQILTKILKDKQEYSESLLNVKDKQNIPAAVKFCKPLKRTVKLVK